jgi:hypothetical protein
VLRRSGRENTHLPRDILCTYNLLAVVFVVHHDNDSLHNVGEDEELE